MKSKNEVRQILIDARVIPSTRTRYLGSETQKPLMQTLSFKVMFKIWDKDKSCSNLKKVFEYAKANKFLEGK